MWPFTSRHAHVFVQAATGPLAANLVAFPAWSLVASMRSIVALMYWCRCRGRWERTGMANMRVRTPSSAQVPVLARTTPLVEVIANYEADTVRRITPVLTIITEMDRSGRRSLLRGHRCSHAGQQQPHRRALSAPLRGAACCHHTTKPCVQTSNQASSL
jgi:hypothetical protein